MSQGAGGAAFGRLNSRAEQPGGNWIREVEGRKLPPTSLHYLPWETREEIEVEGGEVGRGDCFYRFHEEAI